MSSKRKIEVFSAGCAACHEAVELIQSVACSSCDVEVLDMSQPDVAVKAKQYGVKSVPAVVIDGKLADCCAGRGVDEATLRAAGLGIALS
ncbi:MAG: thioredoxin family protein [Acidobacteria bacterium]|nr:thioredoxin family protein [Acidobacteriota bacterium]